MPPRLASEAPTPLREALERTGLSQRALARRLGCDRRQVGSWVVGEHTPSAARRTQIVTELANAGAVEGEVTAESLWPHAYEAEAAA
jgi:transcriptional regulator with XRE-family HTH domain